MKLYLATTNAHKAEEIKHMAPEWIDVVPVSELIGEFDVDEVGNTFLENSVIKAVTVGNICKNIVIADDSGLSIDALNGFPGVRSARYMEGRPYDEKMKTLIRELEGLNTENRKAKFVCAATYYDPKNGIIISYEGYVPGVIAFEPKGDKGFGYDPMFIPDGYDTTFGVLGEEVKQQISHRARAFKGLFELIKKLP